MAVQAERTAEPSIKKLVHFFLAERSVKFELRSRAALRETMETVGGGGGAHRWRKKQPGERHDCVVYNARKGWKSVN